MSASWIILGAIYIPWSILRGLQKISVLFYYMEKGFFPIFIRKKINPKWIASHVLMRKMKKIIFPLEKPPSNLSFTPNFQRNSSEIIPLSPIFSNGGSQGLIGPPFSLKFRHMVVFGCIFSQFHVIPSFSPWFLVLEGKWGALFFYIKAIMIHGSPTLDCTCKVKVLIDSIPLIIHSFLNILIFAKHLHCWKLKSWRGILHMQFTKEYKLTLGFSSNN